MPAGVQPVGRFVEHKHRRITDERRRQTEVPHAQRVAADRPTSCVRQADQRQRRVGATVGVTVHGAVDPQMIPPAAAGVKAAGLERSTDHVSRTVEGRMQCPLATNQGQTSSKAQDLLWQEGRHPLADRAFPAWRYFARRPGSGGSVQSPRLECPCLQGMALHRVRPATARPSTARPRSPARPLLRFAGRRDLSTDAGCDRCHDQLTRRRAAPPQPAALEVWRKASSRLHTGMRSDPARRQVRQGQAASRTTVGPES